VLIDRKHKPWIITTAALAVAAVALYLWDAPRHLNGPRGSTAVGLTFGIAAFAIMLFCAALSLKRRVPHWRLGRTHTWLRAHIWLGLLVVLLVALHSAFRVGGTMTAWLWILLALVTVSGIVGLVLQQMVPSLLTHSTPGETVAQQLSRELESLVTLARYEVVKYAALPYAARPEWAQLAVEDERAAADMPKWRPPKGSPAPPLPGSELLGTFYLEHARPFLSGTDHPNLNNPARAESLFESLRQMTPPPIHPGVDALESLCRRRRELQRQRVLMRVMTAWLVVHVPLSWLLLILTAMHAVVALRYIT